MATFTLELRDAVMYALERGDVSWHAGAIHTPDNHDDLLDEYGVIRTDLDYKILRLADYPIFDEAYRSGLNHKILSRYWNREIGAETVDMFFLHLRRRMCEIMPYFNQLYLSERLNIEPLLSFRTDSTQDGTSTSENLSESKARAVNSETPQTLLAGHEDYASSATDSVSSGTTVSDGATKALQHGEGFTQSQSNLLQEYRATFLNIDLMVIESLDTLFMQIWSNHDEFTPNTGGPFGSTNFYGGFARW